MTTKDIKDVLTYAAFRPEPDDPTAPWKKRFPKNKSLLLNINRDSISWVDVEKNGMIGEASAIDGDLKELAQDLATEWKGLTEDSWCGISINSRYMITLESNLTRKQGSEEMIRTNPRSVLGAKAEKGKRYSVEHNPRSNSSILLSVDEDMIKSVESALSSAGMKVGRIACGPYAMLLDCVDQVETARAQLEKGGTGENIGKLIVVVCCQGSICALTMQDDNWKELRSRSGLYKNDDYEPIVKVLKPLIEHVGEGAQMIFMGDEANTGLPDFLQQVVPGMRFSDVTQPNQLWKILSER
ncbi:MAG: hypothetical protein AAGA58_17290 [Verrucomicrobiota bacterium]